MVETPRERKAERSTETEKRRREAKRPDVICETLKDWIARKGLKPGERLPQEKDLIERFGVSKGTIREALKSLETQGLISTRTGPGGGAFVDSVPDQRAMELLSNYFFFKELGIRDIYELRKQLEPEMAASVIGRLDEDDFLHLEELMSFYADSPSTIEEEHEQRIKELEFHEYLVDACPNPILGFFCRFLISLLKDLTVCRKIYDRPNPELRESGRSYQSRLLDAIRRKDGESVRAIMYQHMCAAQRLMEEQEAIVLNKFLRIGAQDLWPDHERLVPSTSNSKH